MITLTKMLQMFNETNDNSQELFHEYFIDNMNNIFRNLNEADPIDAGNEVDFQTHMADPSRFTVSHDPQMNTTMDDGGDELNPSMDTGTEPMSMAMPGMGGAGSDAGMPDMGMGSSGANPGMRPQASQQMPEARSVKKK